MKDLTKLICDLISFGSQITNSATTEQKMQCLAGIVLRENLSAFGTIDYDKVQEHLDGVKSAVLRGSDFDIDVRARLAQGKPVSIKDIVEFHGKYTVKLSDGRSLSYDDGITHY